VVAQRLGDLVADPHGGVEGGHRVLEDHRRPHAPDLAHLLRAAADQLLALEAHAACHGGVAGGDEPQGGAGQHGLARTGLADDPDGLAAVDVEGHAVDGHHRAAGRVEGRAQVAHLEQGGGGLGRRHRPASFTSRRRRSVSPTKLSDSTVRNIAAEGMSAAWGASSRWVLLVAIMSPQVGSGGGTLRPRTASDPSSTMTTPMATRPKARTGSTTLGTISRKRMRRRVAPSVWAASTNSRWATASVSARATRV